MSEQKSEYTRIVLDNGSGIRLVLTEIRDDCDTEGPTNVCGECRATICDLCTPLHKCEENDED